MHTVKGHRVCWTGMRGDSDERGRVQPIVPMAKAEARVAERLLGAVGKVDACSGPSTTVFRELSCGGHAVIGVGSDSLAVVW